MTGRFINVDLGIISSRPLGTLKNDFESQGGLILNFIAVSKSHLLTVEVGREMRDDINARIKVLCDMVEKLAPKAKMLWESASRRDFDVGVIGVNGLLSASFSISPKSVQRIAAIEGTLTVTVYRPEVPFSPDDKPAQKAAVKQAQGRAKRRPGTDRPIKPKP